MTTATIEIRVCRRRIAWSATTILLTAAAAAAVLPTRAQPPKRAVSVDDLLAMHRVSDPQISPDGKWVAYSVATPEVPANKMAKAIWLVEIGGGTPRELSTAGERPRWSPDGNKIAFLGTANGASQIAWITLDASGGEPHLLTSLPAGADNERWSPDGNSIAFVSNVYPDCADQACNAQRDAEKANSKIHPRVYDRLMFRHWNTWWDGKRSHLFVIPAAGGTPKDLTPGADYDVPPFTLGAPEAIAFSPDSKEICFTANSDREQATSTNGDLFTVPSDGSSAPAAITTNPGNDWGPVYSPDGEYIAYLAQMQPGYESDRWRLMLYSRAGRKHINLTERLDRSVGNFLWTPDSRNIYFQSEEHAEIPIFEISAEPSAATSAPAVKIILKDAAYPDFQLSPDGKTLVFTRSTLAVPAGLFASNANGGQVRELAQPNSPLLSPLDLAPAEPFWFTGASNTQVEGLMVRPPNFDAHNKYPMLLLIHGGPQGAFEDAWSYRWNPEAMAAPGYVVVMINPRGSTGYGSRFTEEISHDWGGKVYHRPDERRGRGHREISVHRWIEARRGRRLIRRFHDRLDRHPLRPIQMLDQPRRPLRCSQHVRDGRIVVPGVGIRRNAVGASAALRQVVIGEIRWRARKIQDAHPGDRWRTGLPHSVHTGAGILHRAAAAGCAIEAGDLSRRGPLGAEAAEQPILVSHVSRLAGDLSKIVVARPLSAAGT